MFARPGSLDPLAGCLVVISFLMIVTYVLSLITGNYSWVDKGWSILPPAYVVSFWLALPRSDARLSIMTALAVAWGVRLTYNFYRKGGYTWTGEDYRWPEIRSKVHPAAFQLLNIVFISTYQHVLLLYIATPAYACYLAAQTGPKPLGWLDVVATLFFIFCLVVETVADEQQWQFQQAKAEFNRAGSGGRGDSSSWKVDYARHREDIGRGFIASGLFQYSRHPNFCAEMSIWWALYLFSVAATGQWINWTVLGTLQLTLLFQGSTWFTEQISVRKYPAYRQYQNTTSRFLPWLPSEQPIENKKRR